MGESRQLVDATRGVTVSTGVLDATFLPGLGMLGVSLRHRGDELLVLPGGLDAYRAGKVLGLPLLAPWANRLAGRRYEVDGVVVDLDGLDLHVDPHGLPIHGTMTAQPGWQVVEVRQRSLSARFAFGARPDLLASFPFPHELRIRVDAEGTTLRVATTIVPAGPRAVPVSFGWHPYLRLPGVGRADVRLGLPARHHVELDDRGLPTGSSHRAEAEDAPLADRSFDDLYRLEEARHLTLSGGGRRLTVEVGDGYHYAQVYAPPDGDFVCLEPMTAPVNALTTGSYSLAKPDDPFTAQFAITIE